MSKPDLDRIDQCCGPEERQLAADFLVIRDSLGIDDTAAAILMLAECVRRVAISEDGHSLADCVSHLER